MTTIESWNPKYLRDLGACIRGVSYKPEDLRPEPTIETVTLLRSNNIRGARLNFADVQFVSALVVRENQKLKSKDIAICMSNGNRALVGKSGQFIAAHESGVYTVGAFCAIFRPFDEFDATYVRYLFGSDDYQRQLDGVLAGSAINNLKGSDIEEITTICPSSKPEQTKIAEILSTVDRAIEQTEALIAKQQRIKTGLMQDLLTCGIDEHGNLRSESTHKFKDSPLGRIPVEWEVSRLESIGTWTSGGTPSKANASYWGDEIPWVCPKDMKTFDIGATIEQLTQAGVRHGSKVMPAKTVFIVVRGMILAHTFPVCIASQPMSFNQDVKAIIANPNIEGRFLAYWLASQENNFLRITTTATHGTKRFDMKEMFDVMMPVPQKEEQTRIVTRLDTTEAQIDSNKKMAAKLRVLKTALMQDLLTGKKRVTPLLESEPKREKMYAQR